MGCSIPLLGACSCDLCHGVRARGLERESLRSIAWKRTLKPDHVARGGLRAQIRSKLGRACTARRSDPAMALLSPPQIRDLCASGNPLRSGVSDCFEVFRILQHFDTSRRFAEQLSASARLTFPFAPRPHPEVSDPQPATLCGAFSGLRRSKQNTQCLSSFADAPCLASRLGTVSARTTGRLWQVRMRTGQGGEQRNRGMRISMNSRASRVFGSLGSLRRRGIGC